MKFNQQKDIPIRYISKLLLIMRLSTVIIFLAIVQVSAASYGQKVTYLKKDITLVKLFKEIKKQTGFNVVWYEETLDATRLVGARFKDAPIEEVMGKALTGLHLTYTISKNTVVIKEKERSFLDKIADAIHSLVKDIHVRGSVTDEYNKPVSGATVKIKGTTRSVITDTDGKFYFENVKEKAVLVISYLGYKTMEIDASEQLQGIRLVESMSELAEVQVMNTGYQNIPKERATGSFVQINNALLNRSVSTGILDRLDGITNGLIFNKNRQAGESAISIRGRSTLFANAEPLIVVDNFPYEGDINNINPNDVENVTILKDAAAASIWGVRAGNGVIVITTKKGSYDRSTEVSFNSNVTIGDKPDLYYIPQLTSSQWIDVEQFLYNKGAYNSTIDNGYGYISPAIEIMKNKSISSADSASQINLLKGRDVRVDMEKYLYRKRINQQYSLGVLGGSTNQKYSVSFGYDHNLNNLVTDKMDRFNVSANNTFSLLSNKLEISTGILFSSIKTTSNNKAYVPANPYDKLSDSNGNLLPVATNNGSALNTNYTDTAGNGKLLDWRYFPINENRSNTTTVSPSYIVNLGLNYKIMKALKLSLIYQYGKDNSEFLANYDLNSFYTRDLINKYSQINSTTGEVIRNIPIGGILDRTNSSYNRNYGRIQANYNNRFGEEHELSAILGFEIRNDNSFSYSNRLYGYNNETASSKIVDYLTYFPAYFNAFNSNLIPFADAQSGSTDRYISYFASATYAYKERYSISGSIRRDESNLFGVSTNQKGVPLWSVGASWDISKENLYQIPWLTYLKLRTTFGYTGNVDKTVSAYLTAQANPYLSIFNAYTTQIVNPPNPSLRWEKDRNINFGLDFSILKGNVNGSLEYFIKQGIDLIGNAQIAPQTGVTAYRGNSADTRSNGIDFTLNTVNFNGIFKWRSSLNFNYIRDKITQYGLKQGSNGEIISTNYTNPLVGYPYISLFSYKWNGLDDSGNPQGSLNGKISSDYTLIQNSTNRNDLVYSGSASPVVFGNFRNTFNWRNIELSFNIIYKLDYYFRRASLNNSILYGSNNFVQADYNLRWQKKGDEKITNVPSLIYPANGNRDDFYTYSEVLVEKGDHIRLQDVQISFTMNKKTVQKLKLSELKLYAYASNLMILWRANKYGIDPDFPTSSPNPKAIAFGIKAGF